MSKRIRSADGKLTQHVSHRSDLQGSSNNEEQVHILSVFLERTVKSYQFEHWSAPLTSQTLLALEAARTVGDAESEGKALIRLLGAHSALDAEQRRSTLAALQQWCKEGKVPSRR